MTDKADTAPDTKEADTDRRTDHLSGMPSSYGDRQETGAQAFQRQHKEATGKDVAEIAIPTSSGDTIGLTPTADQPPLVQTSESLPKIETEQIRVAAEGPATDTDVDATGLDEPDDQDKSTLRGRLPDDFPGVDKLRAENLDTYGKLRSFRGSFSKLDGIGEATEAKIREAAGLDAYTPPS